MKHKKYLALAVASTFVLTACSKNTAQVVDNSDAYSVNPQPQGFITAPNTSPTLITVNPTTIDQSMTITGDITVGLSQCVVTYFDTIGDATGVLTLDFTGGSYTNGQVITKSNTITNSKETYQSTTAGNGSFVSFSCTGGEITGGKGSYTSTYTPSASITFTAGGDGYTSHHTGTAITINK